MILFGKLKNYFKGNKNDCHKPYETNFNKGK